MDLRTSEAPKGLQRPFTVRRCWLAACDMQALELLQLGASAIAAAVDDDWRRESEIRIGIPPRDGPPAHAVTFSKSANCFSSCYYLCPPWPSFQTSINRTVASRPLQRIWKDFV